MKLSAFLFASTASLALAGPAATVQKRADYCGQWDNQVHGTYTVYNNLWGQNQASPGGWQCTGVDGRDGNTIKWHTSWTWSGGSLPSTWNWSYTGSNMVANVAYDLFTSSRAGGSPEYEIMIWLGSFGGAGPISSTGRPIATVTLAGVSWNVWNGAHSQMNVYSFVRAGGDVRNFKGDLNEFVKYLTSRQGMPSSQILTSVGAGTEPFSGNNARFTVSAYSLTQS
ncbi:hypothetical protein J1614_006966 [Plenodomus biglobosus]|nr:hypothetical protein J1614_006966 [Plenodomus biglobosus]